MPVDPTDPTVSPLDSAKPTSNATEPVDEDLYCLECGYNLRGPVGDPLRCPECAYANPRAVATVSAEQITAQIRSTESAAAWAVINMIVGLLILVPALMFLNDFLAQGDGPAFCCSLAAILLPIGFWVSNCYSFRNRVGARPAWFAALIKYHAHALLLTLVVGLYFAGGAALTWWLCLPRYDTDRGLQMYVLFMAGLAVVFLCFHRRLVSPLHERLVNSIEPMRREIAVGIARIHLRERMRTGR